MEPLVALVMMVKNEQDNIGKSLECLRFVDEVWIGDTGSTDNTLEIVKKKCKKKNKKCNIKLFEWKEFDGSRNEILDWCDENSKAKFFLLMDGNDELRGGENLRKFCQEDPIKDCPVFLLHQEWWNGLQTHDYYNYRLIRRKCLWRYKDERHERLCGPKGETGTTGRVSNVILFQDRRADDAKSAKRFASDEVYFRKMYNTRKEPRDVFYFAQTLDCLGKWEEAYKMYQERSTMKDFEEEVYLSFYRSGQVSYKLAQDSLYGPAGLDGKREKMKETSPEWEQWMEKCYTNYRKAFHHSWRAEPLYQLAQLTKSTNVLEAYMFIRMACELGYPDHAMLIVDKEIYDSLRWEECAVIGSYAYHYLKEGKKEAKELAEKATKLLMQNCKDKVAMERYKGNLAILSKLK